MELQQEEGPHSSIVEEFGLYPEGNGKPLKYLSCGETESNLHFQKDPSATVGGCESQYPGEWH